MKNKTKEALIGLQTARAKLHTGGNYDECMEEAKIHLAVLNEAGRKVAKKFGKKYKNLNLTSIMR